MQNEIWKDVTNYFGLYQVSNYGRVKSLSKKSGYLIRYEKVIKPRLNKHGYSQVTLSKKGIKRTFSVHRLVLIEFVINEQNKPCIDHIDGNKENNNVQNLRWVSYSENSKNPLTIQKQKNRKPKKRFGAENKKSKKVFKLNIDKEILQVFNGVSEAERITGIKNISRCALGKCKTAGGYLWRY